MNARIWFLRLSLVILAIFAWTRPAAGQGGEAEDFLGSLNWVKGPSDGALGEGASVKVPERYLFLGGEDTRKIMAAFGNIVNNTERGLLAPESFRKPDETSWFMVFEFDDVGYVKDDERDELDAEAMLESIRRGNEAANQERTRRGATPLTITGWHTPPHYDPESNNLEWCILAESDGEPVINYNTRVLGRLGVMAVTLVMDPKNLESVLPEFKQLLTGFSYGPGHKYAEYRQGDKIAKYGLAALVVGAAAAGAAKLGLFATLALFLKKAWKLIVLGVVAVATFFRRLIFGRERPSEPEGSQGNG